MTLDPDAEALVKQAMRERGISFKEAINLAVRMGLGRSGRRRFRQRSFALGFRPDIPYEKALRLAGELEDQELLRKLSLGK